MIRPLKDLFGRSGLDDLTEVHDRHPVADTVQYIENGRGERRWISLRTTRHAYT